MMHKLKHDFCTESSLDSDTKIALALLRHYFIYLSTMCWFWGQEWGENIRFSSTTADLSVNKNGEAASIATRLREDAGHQLLPSKRRSYTDPALTIAARWLSAVRAAADRRIPPPRGLDLLLFRKRRGRSPPLPRRGGDDPLLFSHPTVVNV